MIMMINEIQNLIPHRYPFLLVDRIEKVEVGKKIVGLKNVTVNEEFFQGHYPAHPIMPGVLIIESMAQVGGLLMMRDMDNTRDKVPLLAGIDKARFRRNVVPGDQLKIVAEVLKFRGGIAKINAVAYVGEEVAAEAELMFAIRDKN